MSEYELSDRIKKISARNSMLFPGWEFILALLIAAIFSLFFYYGYFNTIENATLDFRFSTRGELPPCRDILLVNITGDCLDELGNWPWPRETHGRLLDVLRDSGASLAAFDIIFSEPSPYGEKDDKAFADAIRRFRKVVLPHNFSSELVWDNEIGDFKKQVAISRPAPILEEAVPYEGYIDINYKDLNPDGVIRKLKLLQSTDKFYSWIFGLAIAQAYFEVEPELNDLDKTVKIGGRTLRCDYSYEPAAKKGMYSYLVNYAGKHNFFSSCTYADVLNGRVPSSVLAKKVVLIGMTAEGVAEDLKFSPYGGIPGVEIHANLLYDIFQNRIFTRVSYTTAILLIFMFAMAAALLLWRYQEIWADLLLLAASPLWLLSALLLFYYDYVLIVTPVAIMLPVIWAVTRLIQQFQELKRTNSLLVKRVKELAVINEVSRAVSFMGDLEKTLNSIVEKGITALNAERGSIYLLDGKYEKLVERAVLTAEPDEKAETGSDIKDMFKMGKGIAGEVFSSNRPRLIQNTLHDRTFSQSGNEKSLVKSLICVPLTIRDNPIGVMNLSSSQASAFNKDDLRTSVILANQAAVVIEKARLYNLATVDGLTGLVVRRHLESRMEEEFRRAARYKTPLAYIMTDIDHFKKFNDTYGHQIGDLVLKEVATLVREVVRETDVAGRYGGEEFGVLLTETEPDGAMQFAERLRAAVESAVFESEAGDLKVTISVGVCAIPANNPKSIAEMIKMADSALYVCKRNGRNRVERADDETYESTLEKQ